jgi:hypothetical protein
MRLTIYRRFFPVWKNGLRYCFALNWVQSHGCLGLSNPCSQYVISNLSTSSNQRTVWCSYSGCPQIQSVSLILSFPQMCQQRTESQPWWDRRPRRVLPRSLHSNTTECLRLGRRYPVAGRTRSGRARSRPCARLGTQSTR